MKTIIVTIAFIVSSITCFSQIITIELDTCQVFEHPVLMSTPQAIKLNKIVYKNLYEHNPKLVITCDLNKMTETFNCKNYDILKVNQTNNIIDVVVSDNGNECLEILGQTNEGGIMYLFEYRDGELIKGFFTKNPKFTIE
jgi:hypothetical protein